MQPVLQGNSNTVMMDQTFAYVIPSNCPHLTAWRVARGDLVSCAFCTVLQI
jgi:hypothetical protein